MLMFQGIDAELRPQKPCIVQEKHASAEVANAKAKHRYEVFDPIDLLKMECAVCDIIRTVGFERI